VVAPEARSYGEPTSPPLESDMYLMRIGPPGAEKPVVRSDDGSYVDVSDVMADFNEAFFGG